MAALVIAEHDNASLKVATRNAVTAAALCSTEVHVLVLGKASGPACAAAAKVAGVSKVLHADSDAFAHGLAENVAAQVLGLAQGYSHILFAATASGKNCAPRVAAPAWTWRKSPTSRKSSRQTPSSAQSTPATRLPPCKAWMRSR